MDDLERAHQEAIATDLMRRQMAEIRALNEENLGTEEERIIAIKRRFKKAGYPVEGLPEDEPKHWVTSNSGPDYLAG